VTKSLLAHASKPQVVASVLIPTWNGKELLRSCLDSLAAQTFQDFEVIVADNGSVDGTCEMLQQEYDWVRVVALKQNLGFARGVQAAYEAAGGDLIVLLNNDTEALPAWLEELHSAAQDYPEAGSFACKILLHQDRRRLHSAGDFYGRDGVPGNRGVWEEDGPAFNERGWVFGAQGAACAYRRSLLDDVGFFDEDLVSYCEDVDLNWRANLRGFRCLYVPEAQVFHHVSATGGGALASYFCGRNFIAVAVKDIPGPFWRRYWRRILTSQLRITYEALRSFRGEAARARLRGQLAGIALIPAMLHKRRIVQGQITVDLAQVEKLMGPWVLPLGP
jgi:GT2 family glycosyltransferase